MSNWLRFLQYDPLPALQAAGSAARYPSSSLDYFVRRDLTGEPAGPIERLWELPEALKILKKQRADGSWRRAGKQKHTAINFGLIETWRWLRVLVDQYGFNRSHPQAALAAEFLFSCQTEAGDFRGILANQYATYYSGTILALLVRMGYVEDERIDSSFAWLLAMRQDDGGWTIPMLTHKLDRATQYRLTSQHATPLEPIRSLPFSHNWTGMVLRAFADHPRYRQTDAALRAGHLLKTRFFQPDAYSSYQAASYWLRFEFPFWWNNLVAALDALALMGFSHADEHIQPALNWLQEHQEQNGLWRLSYARPKEEERESPRGRAMRPWVGLAICRIFKRFLG